MEDTAEPPRADRLAIGEELERVLAGLSPAQREVLELAYLHGLTQTAIAERLGEPLGTVKTRMRRGMARLRALATNDSPETNR